MSNPIKPQHGEFTAFGRWCQDCGKAYPVQPLCSHLETLRREALTRVLELRGGAERYEGDEIAISVWKFPREGEQFQISTTNRESQRSGNGYLLVSLNGAAQLWRELGNALRKREVIV